MDRNATASAGQMLGNVRRQAGVGSRAAGPKPSSTMLYAAMRPHNDSPSVYAITTHSRRVSVSRVFITVYFEFVQSTLLFIRPTAIYVREVRTPHT